MGETKLQKEVRLLSYRYEFVKEAKQNIQKGIKSHFHFQNRLLWYKQNWFYVLEMRLRDVLLKECHDGPLMGHDGANNIITFLKKIYYWPNLKNNAKEYMKTCLICQKKLNIKNNKKTSKIVATVIDS